MASLQPLLRTCFPIPCHPFQRTLFRWRSARTAAAWSLDFSLTVFRSVALRSRCSSLLPRFRRRHLPLRLEPSVRDARLHCLLHGFAPLGIRLDRPFTTRPSPAIARVALVPHRVCRSAPLGQRRSLSLSLSKKAMPRHSPGCLRRHLVPRPHCPRLWHHVASPTACSFRRYLARSVPRIAPSLSAVTKRFSPTSR